MAATYTRKGSYNNCLKQTPYFSLTRRKPNLSNMRIFGSECVAYTHKKQKLDPRCNKGILVGYAKGNPEVVNLVKGIDEGKATGLDNIPFKLLKTAADVVSPSLTCIFNQSLLTGIYPSDWKLAKVTPIFKNGSKIDLRNYRPISVIPAVAKIFEKNIYDQLYNYLNVNDLLTSCQSGFRSLHNTLTALLETSNNWCVNVQKGLLNGVIFIDLRKAFDTIDYLAKTC